MKRFASRIADRQLLQCGELQRLGQQEVPLPFNAAKTGASVVAPAPATRSRRGVAAVEGAFALSCLLLLLFGLFDLGIGVLRHNMLSVAAHAVARSAIVRGSATSADNTAWGPQAYSGNMGNGSLITQAASDYLLTMPLSQVTVNISWLDGTNDTGDRVKVSLGYQHEPVTPFLSALGTISLQGTATLHIQE